MESNSASASKWAQKLLPTARKNKLSFPASFAIVPVVFIVFTALTGPFNPLKADAPQLSTPFYNCYLKLTPYNAIPQELVGPRTVQNKTFEWIKSFVILRQSSASGENGFYLVTPSAYYFIKLADPVHSKPAPAANTASTPPSSDEQFLELIVPKKLDNGPYVIRMSISSSQIKSEEVTKGFPQTPFPPNIPFKRVILYEKPDPEIFPIFSKDLITRITSAHAHYLLKKSKKNSIGAWADSEYIHTLQDCGTIQDPEIQTAVTQEIAKFHTAAPPSVPIQPPVPNSKLQEKLDQLWNFIPLPIANVLIQIQHFGIFMGQAALNLFINNPSNQILLICIFLLYIAVQILFRKRFKGAKVVRKFCKAYGFKYQRSSDIPLYSGVLKDLKIEISHPSWIKNPFVEITVEVKGSVPEQLTIHLKTQALRAYAKIAADEAVTSAMDDEFFEKYVSIQAARPELITQFLSPWRKSILRQCLTQFNVTLAHSKLIYRHPVMFQDFGELESLVLGLLNIAVLLTPK